ncbi:MAG: hypothetical protein ACKVS9_15035 [Phycisphaerae bacterium]
MAVYTGEWAEAFLRELSLREANEPLRAAAVNGNFADWTRLLTAAVVRSCESLGWSPAAKGHRSTRLPQAGQEYLGIDVMAFGPADEANAPRWPLPLAVFELENQKERAGYSLWKVICVRASLRVVFAYRNDWAQVRELVRELAADVLGGLSVSERLAFGGDLLIVTGSRGEGETFPYGFFKIWRYNANTASFEKYPGWG